MHALRDLRQPVALRDREPGRGHRRRRCGQHEECLVERHVRGQRVAARSDRIGLPGPAQQDPSHDAVAPQDPEVVELRDDLLARRPWLDRERHVVLRAAGSPAVSVVSARRDHAAHEQQEDDQQGEKRTSPGTAARSSCRSDRRGCPCSTSWQDTQRAAPGTCRRQRDASSQACRMTWAAAASITARCRFRSRPRPASRGRPPRWRDARPAAPPAP